MEENNTYVITNLRVFYDMVNEYFEQMNILWESGRQPKPNGEPGFINTFDPKRKSFKAALIVIAFSGIYLEALLHLRIVEEKGLKTFKEYDWKPYEEKLNLLGCSDKLIFEECKHFRQVRKEILHEKAHMDSETIRIAQEEATRAFKLIGMINDYFKIKF